MNLPPTNRVPTRRGFSLTEVAIAIGIAGVALMSVVALIPALIDLDRAAGLNTALPQLHSQAMAKLRADTPPPGFPQTVEMYFTEAGGLVPDNEPDVMRRTYRCVATMTEVTTSASPFPVDGGVPEVGQHAWLVTLEFTPAAEPSAKPKVFHAALSR